MEISNGNNSNTTLFDTKMSLTRQFSAGGRKDIFFNIKLVLQLDYQVIYNTGSFLQEDKR